MSQKKMNVLMIGSLPISVEELVLAPAIISGMVKNRGHNFEFVDINLELYEQLNKNQTQYHHTVNQLQSFDYSANNPIVEQWFNRVMERIAQCDCLLVSVFSFYSQATAQRFIQATRKQYPHVKILVGGIGSQKKMPKTEQLFGQYLVYHNLVDGWQTDTSTSEIERLIPALIPSAQTPAVDFSIFDFDRYQWLQGQRSIPMLGSHGCVRQCTFCDVIKHFPKYNFVQADQLTKQIVQAYEQTKVGKIVFMDSLVNGSMSNFKNLLQNLAHSKQQGWLPENFSWSGTYICRSQSTLLDQIHQLLPESGVDSLTIGVETGSDRIRFEMDKKFTNDDLIYELDAFEKHGVKATALFFAAWPTETLDDFAETIGLFQRLSRYGQTKTLDSVMLGATGFSLIDGTPIDQNKEEIGLQAGPTPFLWHCASNPGLNFWETLRRRMFLGELAVNLGIPVARETEFLNFVMFNLRENRQAILDYTGPLDIDLLDFSSVAKHLPQQHCLKFTVINSGSHSVQVNIINNDRVCLSQTCAPGITNVECMLDKIYANTHDYQINFTFDSEYTPEWAQYDSGDYYSLSGVYIDNIFLDYRDITFWGWNNLVTQQIISDVVLPVDYQQHINKRCVIHDTALTWSAPANASLHKHLIRTLENDECQPFVKQLALLLENYKN